MKINVFTKDVFQKIVEVVEHPSYTLLNSHFTDQQAKHICSKMSNRRIRHFSKLFLTDAKNIDKQTLKYQIHYLANKALGFYGGKILTFIFNLKEWYQNDKNVEVVYARTKKVYEEETNFPRLQILSSENDSNFMIFFTKPYERLCGNNSALQIVNYKTKVVSRVSLNGLLIDKFDDCIPEIALFLKTINGRVDLYSGFNDGHCDICGRALQDPISIKYGRGPTCRRSNSLI